MKTMEQQVVKEVTDDFCTCFATRECCTGPMAALVALGELPAGVDSEDIRVRQIIDWCKRSTEGKDVAFTAPAFSAPPRPKIPDVYVWWGWNPNYPYWSKSCWKANSIEEALRVIEKPNASNMQYYHCKLIRETTDDKGTVYTEVYDLPPDDACLKIWRTIADQHEEAKKSKAATT